jgi:ubiquitin carboxyl-terminal hydrolase 10
VQIEALPPILVLHLERFLYDATADGIVKTSKSVQFAPELEIPIGTIFSFVSHWPRLRIPRGSLGPEIMSPVAAKSAEPVQYKLYGVLYHHGESASSGHYTVDVLSPIGDNNSWLRIDNKAARLVQHEDMFGGHGNGQGDDTCAYMLFYCHPASARTLLP